MKIVQSFWSKPFLKKEDKSKYCRKSGGFLEKKYFYFSTALSCLQLCKYYQKVELITDDFGMSLLVDKLKLPYTSVKLDLNILKNIHQDLWAMGKLKAYELQDEPFIHVDNDVYIWEKFPDKIENAQLISQNKEINFKVFNEPLEQIYSFFEYIPHFMKCPKEELIMYNAGIFGGNDFSFFKKYVNHSYEFVNRNLNYLEKIDKGLFNCFYEQYVFHRLVDSEKRHVECLLGVLDNNHKGLAEFAGVPTRTKFIHLLGFYKTFFHVSERLESRFRMDYPEYYYRIIELLKKGEI